MITMLNVAKSYTPEILTQVCYISITRMLLNLVHCVILLNYTNCVPMVAFSVHGGQLSFITKQTLIDYLFLEKK